MRKTAEPFEITAPPDTKVVYQYKGKDIDIKRMIFGHGTVGVAIGMLEADSMSNVLILGELKKARVVGGKIPVDELANEYFHDGSVELVFESVESVDVVINALKRIKKELKNEINI